MTTIQLIKGGRAEAYKLQGEPLVVKTPIRFTSRIAYAAAHVVIDPLKTMHPLSEPVIDWDATLAYREYLYGLGFAVAEAMDTSQRGMGLSWPQAKELIERSAAHAKARGGVIACGVGTDHLDPQRTHSIDEIVDAYRVQLDVAESQGCSAILMASRALAKSARSHEEYAQVYRQVLSKIHRPAILHWLGPMFDPALEGYWGSSDPELAMSYCREVIAENRGSVDGIKVSMLSAELEIKMRRALPEGVKMYTGDDFNYPQLIVGDSEGYSHALLGIFDAIAPAAALALQCLDAGDMDGYHKLLAPTVPLSRHIFQAPTYYYKTGIVFLAWLNGFQPHFRMLAGAESARGVEHLCGLFRFADAAGLLRDPDLALARMRAWLMTAGVQP